MGDDTTRMSEVDEALSDARNLLEYAQALGFKEVEVKDIVSAKGSEREAPRKRAASGLTKDEKARGLEDLSDEIGDCTRCKLCKGRQNIVFGVGSPDADIMFIGEGPGRDEDVQGEPFVGRAGQLLTKIIEAMGYKRSEVYIANIVKCLRYNAMVQLGDGRWERIGRLVRNRYSGTVRSIDSNGHITNKRVIGWHESPLADRSVYRLTYKSARRAGASKCAIYLTGDHPVLTERGYIEACKLKKEDRIASGQGFSKTAKSVISGMLLGDGHINAKQAHLSFSHSHKQSTYAKFKASLLRKELGCKIKVGTASAGGERRYSIVQCRTLAQRGLHIIRDSFYKGRKKIVPDYLAKEIDLMALAIWFMDDGYMRIRPPRKPSAEIATCSFSKPDIEILLKGIKNLGINAYTRNNRIFFDVEATKKLSKLIAPYVPPSMRWKIHPEIEKKVAYQPSLYKKKTLPEVLYDQVDVSKINHMGTDKTFFCIDVEDTHNFVTTGGVVHNCRPPNNRNPEPDETGTCKPFLIRQVEIIEPRVIVCLGSVATQNLLETEDKISQMRGKFTEWQGTPVMPTYHPAFLLRNSNMKKPVWEDMQKVMEAVEKQ